MPLQQTASFQIHTSSTADTIRIRQEGETVWTMLPAGTTSMTYVTMDPAAGDNGMAIVYNTVNWAFDTSNVTTATSYTHNDPWNLNDPWQTVGTMDSLVYNSWSQTYETMRNQRVQSDLQRARAAARGAGDMEHEFDLDTWIEANDSDDFDDAERLAIMVLYGHSWAIAHSARLRREADAARRAEAERRAEHLLTSLLDATQKRDWLANRGVTEIAPSGRIWRLIPQMSGGQTLMDPERPTVRRATLCVHPTGPMPAVDSMVASLLAVRNGDEDMLLGLANVHSGNLTEEEREIKRVWRERRDQRAALRRAAVGMAEAAQGIVAGVQGIAAQAERAAAVFNADVDAAVRAAAAPIMEMEAAEVDEDVAAVIVA